MDSSTGILRAAGLTLACGVVLLLSTAAYSESAVTSGSKAAGMNSCVAPTAEMRRNHMDYLKHDRDSVVRKGVRDVNNSLADCIECHAEKDGQGGYHPVNAEGQFCSTCHAYLAVSLTCFQCHSKTPEQKQSGAASLSGGGSSGQEGGLGLLIQSDEAAALSVEEMVQLHAVFREE